MSFFYRQEPMTDQKDQKNESFDGRLMNFQFLVWKITYI